VGLELQPGRRQYVKFSFFKVLPEWRRQPLGERAQQAAGFREVVERWAEQTLVRCYSTVGTRGDTDFLTWHVSYDLEDIHRMSSELLGTDLAGWLTTPYSYLSMTKHSKYVERYAGPGRDGGTRLSLAPGEHKYLFVYPLTKVRGWYGLTSDERQEAMNQHMAIGATYRSVKLNTTYSFGLDDQEFVLAFETDEPGDFLDLVQELRPSMSSAYTETDVPIFTCIAVTPDRMLESVLAVRQAVGV